MGCNLLRLTGTGTKGPLRSFGTQNTFSASFPQVLGGRVEMS